MLLILIMTILQEEVNTADVGYETEGDEATGVKWHFQTESEFRILI